MSYWLGIQKRAQRDSQNLQGPPEGVSRAKFSGQRKQKKDVPDGQPESKDGQKAPNQRLIKKRNDIFSSL